MIGPLGGGSASTNNPSTPATMHNPPNATTAQAFRSLIGQMPVAVAQQKDQQFSEQQALEDLASTFAPVDVDSQTIDLETLDTGDVILQPDPDSGLLANPQGIESSDTLMSMADISKALQQAHNKSQSLPGTIEQAAQMLASAETSRNEAGSTFADAGALYKEVLNTLTSAGESIPDGTETTLSSLQQGFLEARSTMVERGEHLMSAKAAHEMALEQFNSSAANADSVQQEIQQLTGQLQSGLDKLVLDQLTNNFTLLLDSLVSSLGKASDGIVSKMAS